MTFSRSSRFAAALIVTLALSTSSSFAQQTAGSIRGTA